MFGSYAGPLLVTTIAFLLVAKFWSALSRAVGSGPSFGESVMHEAAQRFREEFERLSASQSIYLSAALVFAMLFAAAHVFFINFILFNVPIPLQRQYFIQFIVLIIR